MFDTTNYEDPISSLYVKLLTDRQTDKGDKPTDRQTLRVKHNLLGGGRPNPKKTSSDISPMAGVRSLGKLMMIDMILFHVEYHVSMMPMIIIIILMCQMHSICCRIIYTN